MSKAAVAIEANCGRAVITRMCYPKDHPSFRWPSLKLLFKIYRAMGHPIPHEDDWRTVVCQTMAAKGLSAKQAGELCGCSRSTFSKICNPKLDHQLRVVNFLHIMKALEIDVVWEHIENQRTMTDV